MLEEEEDEDEWKSNDIDEDDDRAIRYNDDSLDDPTSDDNDLNDDF